MVDFWEFTPDHKNSSKETMSSVVETHSVPKHF